MPDGSQVINEAAKIPNREHWAILTNRTEHIPGDQRSQNAQAPQKS
jgi:hypothetical protein